MINLIIYFTIVFNFRLAAVFSQDVPEVKQEVFCETTKGPIKLEIYPEWAPLGAKRFIELVKDGFYTDIALFRCVERFLTQFGISENPSLKHWHRNQIPDDPNLHKGIKRHFVSFAGGGPNTRSTQIFFAFEDLDFLGHEPWEVPFGKVVGGTEVLDKFYKGYGDIPPFGKGPDQVKLFNQGNKYIHDNFPLTDFIKSCSLFPHEDDEQTATRLQQNKKFEKEELNELELKPLISDNENKQDEKMEDIPLNKTIENNQYIRTEKVRSTDNSKINKKVNVAITAFILLGFALVVLYILSQYQSSDSEIGKTV